MLWNLLNPWNPAEDALKHQEPQQGQSSQMCCNSCWFSSTPSLQLKTAISSSVGIQVSSLPGSRKESTLLGYLPLTWYFPCIISISRISVKRYSLSQEAICRLVFAWNLEYLLGTNLDMLLMPVTWTRLTDLRAMGGEAVTEVRREIDSNNPDWATGPQGCWGKLDWVNR